MAGDRGQRLIQEIDFSKGLVLGYSNREHEIPEGFCTTADNFVMNQDGSLAPRPSLHVWNPHSISGQPDTPLWNQPGTSEYYVSCYKPTGSTFNLRRHLYLPGFTGASTVLTLAGTQALAGVTTNPEHLANTLVGSGASYGSITIIPFVVPGHFTSSPPAAGVSEVGVSAPVQLVRSDNNTTINLYDVNGHFVNTEGLADPDPTTGVFVRLLALSWKGRIFVIGGTRVSFSAPGQPTTFAAASGGGFFNLDTSSQVVGAFILQDVLYIATREELFSFSFSTDPTRDGQLRPFASIGCLGAAEYDNVGYIAVREGLYRIISGQLAPTFIPSSESFMSFQTMGLAREGVATVKTEIPRHCSISKIGDQLILGGIGVNALPVDSNPRVLIFSTSTEAWTSWSGHENASLSVKTVNQWFNTMVPLVKVPNEGYGDSLYWGSCIRTRTQNTGARERCFIVINRSEFAIDEGSLSAIKYTRYYDRAGVAGDGTGGTAQYIHSTMETGFLTFQDPLSWKRLHRVWITGKFMYNIIPFGGGITKDATQVELIAFTPPSDEYTVVSYPEVSSFDRITPDAFDISPDQIKFAGQLRFMFFSIRYEFFPNASGSPDPVLDTAQSNMNIALSKMFVDLTVYNQANKAF